MSVCVMIIVLFFLQIVSARTFKKPLEISKQSGHYGTITVIATIYTATT